MVKNSAPKIRQCIIYVAVFLLCSALVAYAQEEGDNYIGTYARYMPPTSARAMPGRLEIVESGIEYIREFKVCNKLPVEFVVAADSININSSSEVKLPAQLAGLTTAFETTLPFFGFKNTYQRIGISPSFYGDSWNFEATDFRMPMRYFIIHKPNEKWAFIFGTAVFPSYELKVLPILGFVYRPNEKLIFNIVPRRPHIDYYLNNRLTLFIEEEGSFNSEFEVDMDGRKDVVLRYDDTFLGCGLNWAITKFIQSSFTLGAVFNRCLKYRDSLGKVNIKNGFYTQVRLEAQF